MGSYTTEIATSNTSRWYELGYLNSSKTDKMRRKWDAMICVTGKLLLILMLLELPRGPNRSDIFFDPLISSTSLAFQLTVFKLIPSIQLS